MFGIGSRDELSLSNCEAFFEGDNIDNLLYFVNEVPLKGGFRQYDDFSFRKMEITFQKGAQKHGVKIVRPLRILVLRMLKQNMGFVDFHVFFLIICKKLSVYKEALPILEYPALFKHVSKNIIAEFLINGADIYIKLRRYRQAFELVNRGDNIDLFDNELEVRLIMRRIVLGISLGYGVPYDIKEKLGLMSSKEEHLKMLIPKDKAEHENDKAKKELYQFLAKLNQYRPLTPQQQSFLRSEGLMDLFEAGKGADLGAYIAQHIKKNSWRVKATEIENTPLDNLDIIRGVNLGGQIYRYDCKNKIMYFNHKEADQEKLNDLITKAFNMSQEVVFCKIDREDRMDGIGGMKMGGRMGLGGMGVGDIMSMFGGGGMSRRGF